MEKEFYTLGTFELETEAQVIKAKLESEGVPAFIWEENRSYANPTSGTSITGIKLQVYKEHKDRALKIYDDIRSYALNDDGTPVTCPNCKAQKSERYYDRKGLFYKLFPFFEPRKYKCLNCNMITRP